MHRFFCNGVLNEIASNLSLQKVLAAESKIETGGESTGASTLRNEGN